MILNREDGISFIQISFHFLVPLSVNHSCLHTACGGSFQKVIIQLPFHGGNDGRESEINMADKPSQKLLSIYISILVLLKLRYNHLNCRKPSMEIVACRISILEDKEESVSTHWT